MGQAYVYKLRQSSNRSPYIFTLVQKVKSRAYKIHAFLNKAIFVKTLHVILFKKTRILIARTTLE